jgi:serine O-acetyltransferase
MAAYLTAQLNVFFPDGKPSDQDSLLAFVKAAMERLEYCFDRIHVKGFKDEGGPRFDHLHTDQYAMFLYFLSNTIFRMAGSPSLASKVYALNKALHGLDAFYEVELPDVFALQHPVGTVLGRGTYANYLYVYQRCSVGSSVDGAYPVLGEGVVMFGGSAVIGGCRIGPNSWLSAGTIVMDQEVAGRCAVFGRSPDLVQKPTRRNVIEHFFEAI